MSFQEEMPKWDIALASLAENEYRKKDAPLGLDDFHQLAREHSIRLDDIMETMFLLAINRHWKYLDASGHEQRLDQETLDGLYVKRRLSEQDLATFDGGWEPAS